MPETLHTSMHSAFVQSEGASPLDTGLRPSTLRILLSPQLPLLSFLEVSNIIKHLPVVIRACSTVLASINFGQARTMGTINT